MLPPVLWFDDNRLRFYCCWLRDDLVYRGFFVFDGLHSKLPLDKSCFKGQCRRIIPVLCREDVSHHPALFLWPPQQISVLLLSHLAGQHRRPHQQQAQGWQRPHHLQARYILSFRNHQGNTPNNPTIAMRSETACLGLRCLQELSHHSAPIMRMRKRMTQGETPIDCCIFHLREEKRVLLSTCQNSKSGLFHEVDKSTLTYPIKQTDAATSINPTSAAMERIVTVMALRGVISSSSPRPRTIENCEGSTDFVRNQVSRWSELIPV
jgi:hypothetical protein